MHTENSFFPAVPYRRAEARTLLEESTKAGGDRARRRGTPGEPKGVVLSHGNLLANLELIERNFAVREGSTCVSWLPPYHDIVRGRNHYPQDIEAVVEGSDPALRPGCGAAFSVDEVGEERVVIVHEVDARRTADVSSLLARIRQRVSESHELDVHAVVLITPRSIAKTTSGKIQRHACKRDYLAGGLQVIATWTATEAPGQVQPAAPPPPMSEAAEDLEAWLRAAVAGWLGLADLDPGEPLTRHGLDSLKAFEVAHHRRAEG